LPLDELPPGAGRGGKGERILLTHFPVGEYDRSRGHVRGHRGEIMGLFAFPRIHLWGTQEANVSTGNNDSASPGAELTVTTGTARARAEPQGMTDAESRQWMMSLDQSSLLRAQWNYFGDFSFRFLDVRVRSVQLGYDRLVSDPRQDPLIGSPVFLNYGVMIDTNPEGYHTTQVFSESL